MSACFWPPCSARRLRKLAAHLLRASILLILARSLISNRSFAEGARYLKDSISFYSNPAKAAVRADRPERAEELAQNRNQTVGTNYTSPIILEGGCSVTIVFLEPRISSHSLWSLESVAANIRPLENACFLIQTATCAEEGGGRRRSNENTAALPALAARITAMARPNFRSMIDRGQVRITLMDNVKYRFQVPVPGGYACDDWGRLAPSLAWMNPSYWGPDEFHPVDSDLVLTVQADVILCHPLNVDLWRRYAWVGAPWPPKSGIFGDTVWAICDMMPRYWKEWHVNGGTPEGALPPYPATNVEICTKNAWGPVGNGGYSLRSRSWLLKAIDYCPFKTTQPKGDGWDEQTWAKGKKCLVSGRLPQEDMVLSTLLRGLGAPLPSAYEASLFASEMRIPEDYERHYNLTDVGELEAMAERLWWKADAPGGGEESGLARYRRMRAAGDNHLRGNASVVPIGYHKPSGYHPQKKMNKKYLFRECPYLEKYYKTHSKARVRNLAKGV